MRSTVPRLLIIVALLGLSSLSAEELRLTTLYRTGGLTKNVGAANLVVRDVVGDARPDIISCTNGAAFAMSFDGTTYHDTWYSPNIQCSAVAVGDRDGNGTNEVIVGTSSGYSYSPTGPSYLYAFDATSYGPEVAKVQVSATEGINDIAIGEADGNPGLEVVALTSTKLYVFDAATFTLKWTAPYGGHDVAIADLENDGVNEIIIAGSDGHVLNGSAQSYTYKWGFAGGFGPTMTVGDVDNDGKAEIVGGSAPYSSGGVLIVNGDTKTTSTLQLRAQSVAVGDVNNDGLNELVVGPDQWGSVEGYTVTGTKLWSINNPEHGVQGMTVGDPDGDGKNQVLWGAGVTSSGADTLFVGNAATQSIEYRGADLDGPFRAVVGDLNGDGRLEMVLTSASTESGYSTGAAYVLDYATHQLLAKLPVTINVQQVAIGQVDGDAAREIILMGGGYYGGNIQVFDGATFAKEWTSPATPCCSSAGPSSSAGMIVRDIDGDGIDEIIYATTDNKIQVLDGASPFIQYTGPALDSTVWDLAIADLDGDSVLDLVVATNGGVYVFKTSDWSQRIFIPLTSLNYRQIAAMPGHVGVTLSGGGIATYAGDTLAQEWSCTSGNTVSDLAFMTLAGKSRLAAAMNDATLRFFPLGGASCPAYDTISKPIGSPNSLVISFADLDGDGRPELLAGTSNEVSISALGWSGELRGDVDADGTVTDFDIDALAAHFYGNRAAAPPADVNGDGAIRPDDLFYLINYRRGTGAPPPQ